jgi:hypothetical protein
VKRVALKWSDTPSKISAVGWGTWLKPICRVKKKKKNVIGRLLIATHRFLHLK